MFTNRRENQGWNKLDSSMLKSKNQVTLFVNYSYNSFYEFHFSVKWPRETMAIVDNSVYIYSSDEYIKIHRLYFTA